LDLLPKNKNGEKFEIGYDLFLKWIREKKCQKTPEHVILAYLTLDY
jgi:hypothetical protein